MNDIKQALIHLQAFKNSHIPMVSLCCWTRRQSDSRQLAKKGTALHTKETPSQADSLKKLLNRKIATKYKQEANQLATTKKWRGIHIFWAEHKGKPRKEVASNFRLKTGDDCLAAHLRKTGVYESSECTVCQMPNSTMGEEYLLHCPKLNTD